MLPRYGQRRGQLAGLEAGGAAGRVHRQWWFLKLLRAASNAIGMWTTNRYGHRMETQPGLDSPGFDAKCVNKSLNPPLPPLFLSLLDVALR